jgi:hypothetical protein
MACSEQIFCKNSMWKLCSVLWDGKDTLRYFINAKNVEF